MLRKIICLLLFQITLFSFAQEQQQNIWLFGTGSKGIVFDPITHNPSVITGKYTPYGAEGCGVATKPSTGELLFYSDGIRVIDANNQLMPNGSGLLGNSSSAQNAWVCGVPGSCSQYYVFSSAGEKGSNPSGSLYYSIVDMTLPGNGTVTNPKGDIVTGKKNIVVNATGSEALTIIKSANYNEYWLLSIVHGTKDIRIYKITTTGIQLSTTYTGAYTYHDPRNIRYCEKIKKFCITSMYELDPAIIGDFNPTTGTITSLSTVPGTPLSTGSNAFSGFYDSEWSPDATKLYLGRYRNFNNNSGGMLYQYDLSNPTANAVLIFNVGSGIGNALGGLKVAPDGKLYVAYNSPTDATRYIARIENPNAPSASIIFTPKAIDMGIGNPVYFKFPEFMIFDNHKPVAVNDDETSVCISQPTDINVLANDTDPDNNTLSANIIKTYKGTSTINGNGTVHYVPSPGYYGKDTIWYTACDNACVSLCDTAYVLICNPRICTNDPPLAVTDVVPCFYNSQTVTIDVLKNDSDPDHDSIYISSVQATHGTATIYRDTLIQFTATAGFSGTATITYTVCDTSTCNTNNCTQISFDVCVKLPPPPCTNSNPVAVTDVVPCFYNSLTVTIDVLKNDSDPDNDSIYISSVQATHGTATIYRDTLIQFTATAGFSGTATITYTVCDTSTCNTNNCSQISFDLCVDPPLPPACINSSPVIVADAFACIYDTTSYTTFDVLHNDSDPDHDPLHISSAQSVHGKVSIYQNTLLHYTPPLGYTGIDTIRYTVCDNSLCTNSCISSLTTICIQTLPINIPNLFTPNGDSHNDVFFIEGLYPNTKVSIYNRWGELVYETNNYDNSWGKNDKVTDGLYYCQIIDPIRGKTYKSWLQILGKK